MNQALWQQCIPKCIREDVEFIAWLQSEEIQPLLQNIALFREPVRQISFDEDSFGYTRYS